MRIYARKYKWYKDLFFQCNVLFDRSVRKDMFDNWRKVFAYFLPCRFYAKYVVIKEHANKKLKIAIGAFLKGENNDVCWIAGFVPYQNQNKGIGVYAGVACLNELFKEHPKCTVFSASHAYNTRAVRVTVSLGFRIYVQDEKHVESTITKEQFYNEFVSSIMRRCKIN